MFEDKRPHTRLMERTPPDIRRAIGGLYRSRTATRLLILVALVSAVFGGVGLDVCLSEPMWEAHVWIPALLIVLAVWIFVSILLHAIRIKLFTK
ncbi:hypothetical protein [Desulfoluna spongiiphila]|uniref:Uncharacterized protein n=1 Tax=Desulfoluna spongiiphila TaxID=419481 RepID=A0A1G5BVR1_9BACT|nr:hypothetical protein [Desulfoluna spongiiphila]SCX94166.1 hypothetical protein SAMN05216233_102220 [Desulfoluna spongiiphila]VVS93940.1 hypothetical protein DBB_35120 [Desulfoluna spongiiphila]